MLLLLLPLVLLARVWGQTITLTEMPHKPSRILYFKSSPVPHESHPENILLLDSQIWLSQDEGKSWSTLDLPEPKLLLLHPYALETTVLLIIHPPKGVSPHGR